MRWFGDPWPSEAERAGVCENDAERIPVPTGEPCAQCSKHFVDGDRGVAIPYVDDHHVGQSFWHLRCMLLTTIGPAVTDTVLARMDGQEVS